MTAEQAPLLLAMTGASGVYASECLMRRSPWPVALVASDWARKVYELECGPFAQLENLAHSVFGIEDLEAPFSSGSVPTRAMVILPCSSNTMAQVAGGLGDNLITRAAHCHLKERRPLVMAVRETPWTCIDLENARRVAVAGATVMPLCPPFYLFSGRKAGQVTMDELLEAFADRVLQLLGAGTGRTWEDVK